MSHGNSGTGSLQMNSFKPKRLEGDLESARPSQLGGCFSDYQKICQHRPTLGRYGRHLDKIYGLVFKSLRTASSSISSFFPHDPHKTYRDLVSLKGNCRQTTNGLPVNDLKVEVAAGVPAVITPLKPKFYLKCVSTIAAKTAVKII